jgi:glycosyltransferase involved in cell wall biosynthesis
MKILFVGGFAMPDRNAAAHRVTALAQILSAEGHEIQIIGLDTAACAPMPLPGCNQTTFSNLKYPATGSEWLKHLTSVAALDAVFAEGDFHVVVCYNYPSGGLIDALRKRKKYKFKLIFDLTEWYEAPTGSLAFRAIKTLDVLARMRLLASRADGLILASRYLSNYYRNVPRKMVIPTLVPSQSTVRSDPGCDEIVFTYAGTPFNPSRTHHSSKQLKERIDLLIQVFSAPQFANCKLHLLGVTKNECARNLDLVPSCFDSANIVYHGKAKHTEVLARVRESDYTIFLRDDKRSNRAGFPTKLSESFACCVPVVTNSVGDAAQYVTPQTGFIVGLEAERLKSELLEIAKLGRKHSLALKANLKQDNPLASERWRRGIADFFAHVVDGSSPAQPCLDTIEPT